MLATIALLLQQPRQEVRTLQLSGMLLTTAEVRITRTTHPDGRTEWLEETKWDDGRLWIDRRTLTPGGSLGAWTIDWKGSKEDKGTADGSWRADKSDSGFKITKSMYRGESMNIVRALRMDDSALSFIHLLVGPGAAPIAGQSGKTLLFIPGIADAGQLHEVQIAFQGEVQLASAGGSIKTYKMTLSAEPRGETWWLDESGLPVRREFWTKNPERVHRTEVIKKG